HNQRQWRQLADSSSPFLIQEIVKLSAVRNAGEAVKTRQAQQHLIRFLKLAHDLKKLLLMCPPPFDFMNQSQHRPDASQELDLVDGFPYIVECPCGKGELEIHRIGLDRYHHNRYIAESFDCFDLAARFDAAHARHDDIH